MGFNERYLGRGDVRGRNAEGRGQERGGTWLGFAASEIEDWFREAALVDLRLDVYDDLSASRELPATFIATARRPA